MNLLNLFNIFKLDKLTIDLKIVNIDIVLNNNDKEAAWLMYVELITRVATQRLEDNLGIEETALDSIYKLFPITREILKTKGRKAKNFTIVSIIFLNKMIRPFTSKWHKKSLEKAFEDENECAEFRRELFSLQDCLINYCKLLSYIAGVEDLTFIKEDEYQHS